MIPNIMHHIWIQGANQMPLRLKENTISCQLANNKTVFMFWDDESISALLKGHDMELYRFYSKSSISFAQKSDIARYVIIYLHGGVYVDTDYKCIKNIMDMVSTVNLFYIPFKDVAVQAR
jgi:inositol phosphorylceramide mannosyltransferase catalytic subunit